MLNELIIYTYTNAIRLHISLITSMYRSILVLRNMCTHKRQFSLTHGANYGYAYESLTFTTDPTTTKEQQQQL